MHPQRKRYLALWARVQRSPRPFRRPKQKVAEFGRGHGVGRGEALLTHETVQGDRDLRHPAQTLTDALKLICGCDHPRNVVGQV